MSSKIFVYGSLMRGFGNHSLLASSTYVARAWTEPVFTLVDLGGFPGMLEGGKVAIAGEIFEVSSSTLERLDRLEGHPTFYRRSSVTLSSIVGQTGPIAVEAYILQRGLGNMPRIDSGSWRRHSTLKHARRSA